jgi:hypothetical protein
MEALGSWTEATMTKGIEDADAQVSALRLALRAIVDALAEGKVVERTDITNLIRRQEEHAGDSVESADVIHQLRELRKLLE